MDPMIVEVPDEGSPEGERAVFRIARQGEGLAGPAIVWLGEDGRERAIVGFDWFDGQIRVLLYDAQALAGSGEPTRVLWLDGEGNYVRSTRGEA